MKRNPALTVIVAATAVATLEIALHWLLGRGQAPSLLGIYLDRGSSGKAFNSGVLDNLIPAAVLGWFAGWAAFPRWSPRKVAVVAVALATFVAALEPLYGILIGMRLYAVVWGSPSTFLQAALFHLYDVLTALLPGGFFAYMAYGGRRDLSRSKAKSLPGGPDLKS